MKFTDSVRRKVGKEKVAHPSQGKAALVSYLELVAISQNQTKAQEQKPPTATAIDKALRVLTTLYRVTLEPLPKAHGNDDEARETKEIVL